MHSPDHTPHWSHRAAGEASAYERAYNPAADWAETQTTERLTAAVSAIEATQSADPSSMEEEARAILAAYRDEIAYRARKGGAS